MDLHLSNKFNLIAGQALEALHKQTVALPM
jgi:hypothetical protein